MNIITQEMKDAWVEVYFKNNLMKDPHQEFADKLGISRIDAKELCYKVIFSSEFLSNMFYSIKN